MRRSTSLAGLLALATFTLTDSTYAQDLHVAGVGCGEFAAARQTDPVPGGGSLLFMFGPSAPPGCTAVDGGRTVFYSAVSGSPRAHGWFATDASGLHALVMGNDSILGSGQAGQPVGDPSPIGGRFTAILGGLGTSPAGDFAFIADVDGGSSARGLFVYRSATQSIDVIATLGDPLPGGAGAIRSVGQATIAPSGAVVFFATGASNTDEWLLRWENGVTSKVAHVGEPTPSGGFYSSLVGTSITSGSAYVPTGPAPGVDASGAICFYAVESSNFPGLVGVDASGVASWWVRAGDPTPIGGGFGLPYVVWVNPAGETAFLADVFLPGGALTIGWFVGRPGQWRKALEYGDSLDGRSVDNFYFGAPATASLSEGGDLAITFLSLMGGAYRETVAVCRADGVLVRVASYGDPTPLGGSYGQLGASPSFDRHGELAFGAEIVNGPPNVIAAQIVTTMCPLIRTYCTSGVSSHGCQAQISGAGVASASTPAGFTMQVTGVEGQRNGLIYYGVSGRVAFPWTPGGTSWICVKSPLQRMDLLTSGGTPSACDGAFTLDFDAYRAAHPGALGQPLSAGLRIEAQAWYRDPGGSAKNTNLSDALEFWIAP